MGASRKKAGRKKANGNRLASRKRKPGSSKPARKVGSKGNRPKVQFDLEDLHRLAQLGCTIEDIAQLLKVSKQTLYTHMAEDEQVKDAIELGRSTMRRNIRTAQLQNAIGGNATMQIWLGKQVLGQRDVRAVEVTGPDGGPLELQADLKPVLAEKLAAFIRSKANGGAADGG